MDVQPFPAWPYSPARLDGRSPHEVRPGDDLIASVVYATDGSTEVTYDDGLRVVVTGTFRRGLRVAVVA